MTLLFSSHSVFYSLPDTAHYQDENKTNLNTILNEGLLLLVEILRVIRLIVVLLRGQRQPRLMYL